RAKAYARGVGLDEPCSRPACERAKDSSARFVPPACDVAVSFVGDVARQLELVAVACTTQVQPEAALVGRPIHASATDAFVRSVRYGDLATACPVADELGEWVIGGARSRRGEGEEAGGHCNSCKIAC